MFEIHEIFNQTGTYAIACDPTGEVYIGHTLQSFGLRWLQHLQLLRCGGHHCRPLQHLWSQYGPEQFSFQILEITTSIVNRSPEIKMERGWLRDMHDEGRCLNRVRPP